MDAGIVMVMRGNDMGEGGEIDAGRLLYVAGLHAARLTLVDEWLFRRVLS